MSLQTWKNEFYPIPADKCRKKDAVVHSLRKWIGFRPENLARHEMGVLDIMGRGPLGADGCALCHKFEFGDCELCPLALARDGVPCNDANDEYGEDSESPYSHFLDNGDPEPMIAFLEKALAETI